VAEEIDRVVPFVEACRAAEPDVLLSVDTFRAPVADAALAAGADIVNDVTGLHDPEVLDVVVARTGRVRRDAPRRRAAHPALPPPLRART
jgi:dihydropteroate synthase